MRKKDLMKEAVFTSLLLSFQARILWADSILFKKPISSHVHTPLGWFYILGILTLLLALLLIKKNTQVFLNSSLCVIVEKKRLSHKTMLYVIEYQNQRFLLADNQQSLNIQPIAPRAETHEAN